MKLNDTIYLIAAGAGAVIGGVWLYNNNRRNNQVTDAKGKETIWEVPYKGKETGCSFYKEFKKPILPMTPYKMPDGWKVLVRNWKPTTGSTAGSSARVYWPSTMRFFYAGEPVGSLLCDPRSGLCLALLFDHAFSSNGDFHTQGTYNSANRHMYGNQIDLAFDDDQMNRLVQAALDLSMPLAWISRYGRGKRWPLFQLRQGIKKEVNHSTSNHDSHYHVYLPRPNWGLLECNNA